MRYSETGYNLEIDLSRGNIEKVSTDIRDTELFLGGLGTNAKLMWDRVPPELDAFSPDNLLIFAAGLLVGTPAQGANRTVVTSLSPQTKLMAFSMMGGFFAPEMKFAGYDKVVLKGIAPELVYIWINNDKVEIRDAAHLHGKGAVETARLIKEELGEPKAQIAAIGLAGENLVFYASIEHDRSSASRGGLGAVMGAKNVKAVAIRGTGDVHLARPVEFMNQVQGVLDYIKFRETYPIPETPPINEYLGSPAEMSQHDEAWHANFGSWGNSRKLILDYWTPEVEQEWTETLESMRQRLISCFNCSMNCAATIKPPKQPVYMLKCYTKMTYAMAAYSNLDFNLKIGQKATEYGLDGISTPQVIACALEMLDGGLLTMDDFPGMPEDTHGRFYYLLEKIVHRDGIGEIMADGLYYMEQKYGEAAKPYTRNHIKRHEQVNAKAWWLNPLYFLMFATGEKIHITQIQGQFPQQPFSTREVREEFVKDWFQVPDDKFKQYFVNWQRRREGKNINPYYPTVQMSCEIVDWQERMHYIDDSFGTCAGLSSFNQKPPYHIHNFPKFFAAGTGIEMDEAKLAKATVRIRSLIRAINNRRGLRRKDDCPPEDHWVERIPELETELLDAYYKFKGWNRQSVPTKESLHELGLDYVARDLIERGVLRHEDDFPEEEPAPEAAAGAGQ